jgi:hypothetical protein
VIIYKRENKAFDFCTLQASWKLLSKKSTKHFNKYKYHMLDDGLKISISLLAVKSVSDDRNLAPF